MRKSTEERSGPEGLGHNSAWIESIIVARLWNRKGDPWRGSDREIEIAMEVLRNLPEDVPLPVVVNGECAILVGHIFVEAARRLGMERLLIMRKEGLTVLQEKQYSIAVTQLLRKGSWDPTDLEPYIREFEDGLVDFSHVLIGFDNGELDKLLGIPKKIADGEADSVPKVRPLAVSREGMLWQASI